MNCEQLKRKSDKTRAGRLASCRRLSALNGFLAGLTILMGFACMGCFGTHIGMWDDEAFKSTDFGPPQTVHVSVYLDQGVTRDEAMDLMQTTIDEDSKYYNINVVPEGFGQLERPGFFHDQILQKVASIPLTGSCDRVFYFAHRNAGDYLYAAAPVVTGVPLPEVLGEVDDATMTHGFAYAENDGINSLMMGGPSSVTRHEFYHLVGSCPHAWTMDQCYQRISSLKHLAQDSDGFFPSMSEDAQHVFKTRGQVNVALGDSTPNADVAANQR